MSAIISECDCPAKDMPFGRCCKAAKPNADINTELLDALEISLAYVQDAKHFPEQFKKGTVEAHEKQVLKAIANARKESKQ